MERIEKDNVLIGNVLYERLEELIKKGLLPEIGSDLQRELVEIVDGHRGFDTEGNRLW